jgi:hypothetical protein
VADPGALARWLASSDLAAPSGHCLSWWNPDRPGYPYPEVSGLLLCLLSLAGAAPERRRELREALLRDYTGSAVCRGAQTYTFDTAMVLSGMLAHLSTVPSAGRPPGAPGPDAVAERAALAGASLLIDAAEQANPLADGRPPSRLTAATRWSMSFGAHQAKVCGALLRAERLFGPLPGLGDAVAACASAALRAQDDDGRFRIHAASPLTYTHSHCYAVEGLLMAAAISGKHRAEAAAGAAWLTTAQRPDGGLLAWHDGCAPGGPPRADATAQALRIWVLAGRERFAGPAARAWAFLAGLSAPFRGLRYEPGSGDVNAWATIFATQAVAWHVGSPGADATTIV